MALYDLSDPDVPLPPQMVIDTSLLLALRPGDDNPYVGPARAFVRRLSEQIARLEMIAWLPLPVFQECAHIILANGLRRIWQAMDPIGRPQNWLLVYKKQPEILNTCLPELDRFRNLLAAIPLTPVRLDDLADSDRIQPLERRMERFITIYHLLPQDALILSEAEGIGVKAVATLDQDWHRVDSFDVYTCL